MKTIEGQCGCEGIAIGPVFVVEEKKVEFNKRTPKSPRDEIQKFWNTKEKAKEQIEELILRSNAEGSTVGTAIFEAYMAYLDDAGFKNVVENRIINDNMTAEEAVETVGRKYIELVENVDNNPRLQARAVDIEEILDRLLFCLKGEEFTLEEPKEPSIIVARNLTPSRFFSIERDKILGFVLEEGAYYSHFAILARTFDIPLIFNVGNVTSTIENGTKCALYANGDKFFIEPTEDKIKEINEAIEEGRRTKKRLEEFKGRDTLTHGGERIILYANVSSLEEIDIALKNDAEGIGLFRTEYMYMAADSLPTEEEQFRIYKEAVMRVDGKLIVFRTADIGGDKQPDYLDNLVSVNPSMGNRGIRFSMTHKHVFKEQLRAIYRAAYYGIGNVNVMYPMITSLEELDWIEAVNREVQEELKYESVKYTVPEQGIVLETPASALICDLFAKRVDFISVGSNDLSQFVFAVDRLGQNLDMEDYRSEAMRRIIQTIVDCGEKEGIPVGLCGDIRSDKETLRFLLDAGIKGLSVQPRQILLFRKYIREL